MTQRWQFQIKSQRSLNQKLSSQTTATLSNAVTLNPNIVTVSDTATVSDTVTVSDTPTVSDTVAVSDTATVSDINPFEKSPKNITKKKKKTLLEFWKPITKRVTTFKAKNKTGSLSATIKNQEKDRGY